LRCTIDLNRYNFNVDLDRKWGFITSEFISYNTNFLHKNHYLAYVLPLFNNLFGNKSCLYSLRPMLRTKTQG